MHCILRGAIGDADAEARAEHSNGSRKEFDAHFDRVHRSDEARGVRQAKLVVGQEGSGSSSRRAGRRGRGGGGGALLEHLKRGSDGTRVAQREEARDALAEAYQTHVHVRLADRNLRALREQSPPYWYGKCGVKNTLTITRRRRRRRRRTWISQQIGSRRIVWCCRMQLSEYCRSIGCAPVMLTNTAFDWPGSAH